MNRALQVMKVGGIPLRFHWSFVLVLLWIGYISYVPGLGIHPPLLLSGLAWVFMIFFCILLHELGHALVARRLDIQTRQIVLFPIGGGAFLERMPDDPREEMLVALGGPLVNILLACLAAPLIWLPDGEARLSLLQYFISPERNIVLYEIGQWDYFLVLFFLLNLMLAFFNLLPAYPLDGGRVLRALLSWPLGRRRATAFVSGLGVLAAAAFLYLAFAFSDWVMGLGGLLVGVFAGFELLVNSREQLLASRQVADFYRPLPGPLYTTDKLGHARRSCNGSGPGPQVVLNEWHELHGILERDILTNTALGDNEIIGLWTRPEWFAVDPQDDLLSVSRKAADNNLEAFPVFSNNQLIGILDLDHIDDWLRRRRWPWLRPAQ